MKKRIIGTLALAAASTMAHGQDAETTTMQVPQGSGTFPTIGQVECLEEEGSGRYCAATYECGNGSSGDLWGDMANHNGRRPIGADSPVANQLDCVVSVDGKATVRWFHGHRPTGRDGNVVGLSPVVSAEPPTIRRDVNVTSGAELWLPWYIRTRNLGDIRARLRETYCDHIKEGTDELDSCLRWSVDHRVSEMGVYANLLLTPVTMCATELAEAYLETVPQGELGRDTIEWRMLNAPQNIGDGLLSRIIDLGKPEDSWDTRTLRRDFGEKYRECRELYEQQLIEFGLADPEQ